jgi:hypothetical protein
MTQPSCTRSFPIPDQPFIDLVYPYQDVSFVHANGIQVLLKSSLLTLKPGVKSTM